MPVSEMSAIERIARVIAGQRLSINADGYEPSVSAEVDAEWTNYRGEALAILRTLREPDAVMADAGDATIWSAMVEAAINDFGLDRR